jgi:hypothetical protein
MARPQFVGVPVATKGAYPMMKKTKSKSAAAKKATKAKKKPAAKKKTAKKK